MAAREIGYPVVLKILSPDISHKSDVGGVRLNLATRTSCVRRPIRPEDELQHRAFVELLQPEDLRLRFLNARRELPHSELARMAQIDYAREMAFIALRTPPDGTAQMLGVVRAIIDPDNVDAEFAIIVRSDLKGQGLARLLLRKMIDFLARRGIQRMVGYVLRENEAMRELAQSQGFVVDAIAAHADTLFLALPLAGGAHAMAYTASALS